jgi:hypothetical protein
VSESLLVVLSLAGCWGDLGLGGLGWQFSSSSAKNCQNSRQDPRWSGTRSIRNSRALLTLALVSSRLVSRASFLLLLLLTNLFFSISHPSPPLSPHSSSFSPSSLPFFFLLVLLVISSSASSPPSTCSRPPASQSLPPACPGPPRHLSPRLTLFEERKVV